MSIPPLHYSDSARRNVPTSRRLLTEYQSSRRAHAWHAHHPPRGLVSLGRCADTLVWHGLLFLDHLVHGKRTFDDRAQAVIVVAQPKNLSAERTTGRTGKKAALLEQAAYLVLQVTADADQSRAGNGWPGCHRS